MDAVLSLTLAVGVAIVAVLACLAAYEKFILKLQEKDAPKAAKVHRFVTLSIKALLAGLVLLGLATGWLLIVVLI